MVTCNGAHVGGHIIHIQHDDSPVVVPLVNTLLKHNFSLLSQLKPTKKSTELGALTPVSQSFYLTKSLKE